MNALRSLLCLLGILSSFTTSQATLDDLQVTVTPTQIKIPAGKPFSIEVSVKNNSANVSKIKEMSCSWYQHWTTDIKQVSIVPWKCTRNVAITIELKPNESYSRKIDLVISKDSKESLTFKVGFLSLDSVDRAWSNEISAIVLDEAEQDAAANP